jgi:hypothetical protein
VWQALISSPTFSDMKDHPSSSICDYSDVYFRIRRRLPQLNMTSKGSMTKWGIMRKTEFLVWSDICRCTWKYFHMTYNFITQQWKLIVIGEVIYLHSIVVCFLGWNKIFVITNFKTSWSGNNCETISGKILHGLLPKRTQISSFSMMHISDLLRTT